VLGFRGCDVSPVLALFPMLRRLTPSGSSLATSAWVTSEENLTSVASSTDTGSAMDIHANITSLHALRLARVEPHPDAYRDTFWPSVGGDGPLPSYSSCNCVPRARKRHEGFLFREYLPHAHRARGRLRGGVLGIR